jgi:hypothetical protein
MLAHMTFKTLIAAAAIALIASPVLAQAPRHRVHAQAGCVNNWPQRSVFDILFSATPEPQANGCAPAVYEGGRFIGQDPDPNVRLELRRNADNEGYHLNTK